MTRKIEFPDWKEHGILWYEYDEKVAVLEDLLKEAIVELYGEEEE